MHITTYCQEHFQNVGTGLEQDARSGKVLERHSLDGKTVGRTSELAAMSLLVIQQASGME